MIKVLIMCQRKKSYDNNKGHNNLTDSSYVDMTVGNIEKYLYDYYKTDVITIEYLVKPSTCENDLYDADYKIWFEPNSKKTNVRLQSYQFIQNHRDEYDMIMLQTCPLMYFAQNFRYLPLLMKDTGVLTIKTFSYFENDIIDSRTTIPDIYNHLYQYFEPIDKDMYKLHIQKASLSIPL